MEVTRVIDRGKGIVHTTITGEITYAEVRADMARLAMEPSYSPDMPGIVDMRNATARLSTSELRGLADVVKSSPKVVGRTRRALLVESDLNYGLYRMFEAFASNGRTEYRVFRDEKDALAWIGAPAGSDSE